MVKETQRVSWPGAGTTSVSTSYTTSSKRLRRCSRPNKPPLTKPLALLLPLPRLVSKWLVAAELVMLWLLVSLLG